jgi:hypothetical protein
MLVPHQPGRAPEAPQIDQLDDRTVLHPRRGAAVHTAGPVDALFDMNTDRLAGPIVDGEHGHVGQSDE